MEQTEQDKIDMAIEDAIDFEVRTQNKVIAEVNRQNTVIKASSKEEIGKFLDKSVLNHILVDGDFYNTIKSSYPLLDLVITGLNLQPPTVLYYKQDQILISIHGDDVVLGIAPKAC